MPRRTKTLEIVQIQKTLQEAAVYAAKLIRDSLRGKDSNNRKTKVKLTSVKLLAAIKAIEHTIGLPKAKIELKTDALTMRDIAEIAAMFDAMSAQTAQENALKLHQSAHESALNGDESDDIMIVPTKPLTARQLKERAQN